MGSLNFDQTEISLSHKTDKELKREKCLFALLNIPYISPLGIKLTSFLSQYKMIPAILFKNTVFKIFCGGETLEEAKKETQFLRDKDISRVFFYSVEGGGQQEKLDSILKKTVEIFKGSSLEENYSALKFTSLISPDILIKKQKKEPLKADESKKFSSLEKNFNMLCEKAYEHKCHFMVDAEESWFQKVIDDFCLDKMRKYNKKFPTIYITLQMYRKDKLAYLKELIQKAKKEKFYLGVKLVRGAYLRKEADWAHKHDLPTVLNPSKAATDRTYNKALKLCFQELDHVALFAGTHNTESIQIYSDLVKENRKKKKYVMSSQLYGMCDYITFNLSHYKIPVSKYIPFGPVAEAMPYLLRRAEENNSILGEARREIELLDKEYKRRQG